MTASQKIKVLIDRSKWRTGSWNPNRTGKGSTQLLNAEGYMCCLGFICSTVNKSVGILGKFYGQNNYPLDKIDEVLKNNGYNTNPVTFNDARKTTHEMIVDILEKAQV